METNKRADRAAELFLKGYNCAQSVIAVYCEELGLPLDTALMLSSSFGGGMGRLREVCGAVSATFMVAGLKYGYTDPSDIQAKKQHYAFIQDLARRFESENGSIVCRELLGLDCKRQSSIPEARTGEYYSKRPCKELVASAVRIFDEAQAESAENKTLKYSFVTKQTLHTYTDIEISSKAAVKYMRCRRGQGGAWIVVAFGVGFFMACCCPTQFTITILVIAVILLGISFIRC